MLRRVPGGVVSSGGSLRSGWGFLICWHMGGGGDTQDGYGELDSWFWKDIAVEKDSCGSDVRDSDVEDEFPWWQFVFVEVTLCWGEVCSCDNTSSKNFGSRGWSGGITSFPSGKGNCSRICLPKSVFHDKNVSSQLLFTSSVYKWPAVTRFTNPSSCWSSASPRG